MKYQKKTGKLFVVSGPSGAGKTTLLTKLFSDIPSLVNSISATTRKPREGETDGRDYFFLSLRDIVFIPHLNVKITYVIGPQEPVHGGLYRNKYPVIWIIKASSALLVHNANDGKIDPVYLY